MQAREGTLKLGFGKHGKQAELVLSGYTTNSHQIKSPMPELEEQNTSNNTGNTGSIPAGQPGTPDMFWNPLSRLADEVKISHTHAPREYRTVEGARRQLKFNDGETPTKAHLYAAVSAALLDVCSFALDANPDHLTVFPSLEETKWVNDVWTDTWIDAKVEYLEYCKLQTQDSTEAESREMYTDGKHEYWLVGETTDNPVYLRGIGVSRVHKPGHFKDLVECGELVKKASVAPKREDALRQFLLDYVVEYQDFPYYAQFCMLNDIPGRIMSGRHSALGDLMRKHRLAVQMVTSPLVARDVEEFFKKMKPTLDLSPSGNLLEVLKKAFGSRNEQPMVAAYEYWIWPNDLKGGPLEWRSSLQKYIQMGQVSVENQEGLSSHWWYFRVFSSYTTLLNKLRSLDIEPDTIYKENLKALGKGLTPNRYANIGPVTRYLKSYELADSMIVDLIDNYHEVIVQKMAQVKAQAQASSKSSSNSQVAKPRSYDLADMEQAICYAIPAAWTGLPPELCLYDTGSSVMLNGNSKIWTQAPRKAAKPIWIEHKGEIHILTHQGSVQVGLFPDGSPITIDKVWEYSVCDRLIISSTKLRHQSILYPGTRKQGSVSYIRTKDERYEWILTEHNGQLFVDFTRPARDCKAPKTSSSSVKATPVKAPPKDQVPPAPKATQAHKSAPKPAPKPVAKSTRGAAAAQLDLVVVQGQRVLCDSAASLPFPYDKVLQIHRANHIPVSTIVRHGRRGLIPGLDSMALTGFDPTRINCVQCPLGRQTGASHSLSDAHKATRPGERLHFDIHGPVSSTSWASYRYYILVVDGYSGYRWFLFLRSRSDFYEKFAMLFQRAERSTCAPVLYVRCDNGSEFNYFFFDDYYR